MDSCFLSSLCFVSDSPPNFSPPSAPECELLICELDPATSLLSAYWMHCTQIAIQPLLLQHLALWFLSWPSVPFPSAPPTVTLLLLNPPSSHLLCRLHSFSGALFSQISHASLLPSFRAQLTCPFPSIRGLPMHLCPRHTPSISFLHLLYFPSYQLTLSKIIWHTVSLFSASSLECNFLEGGDLSCSLISGSAPYMVSGI